MTLAQPLSSSKHLDLRPPSFNRPRLRSLRPILFFSSLSLIIFLYRVISTSHRFDYPKALLAARPDSLAVPMTVAFAPNVQNGFGAQVLHLLDAAALAHYANPQAQLCVRQARYWNYGCAPHQGWSCYFASSPCRLAQTCPELSRLTPRAVWRSRCILVSSHASSLLAARIARRLANEHPVSSLAHFRHVSTTVWRFNKRTAKRISDIWKRIALRPGSYVAVHIRRGDKRTEAKLQSVERYAAALRILAGKGEPIFVATDDGAVLAPLRSMLSGHKVLALAGASARKGHLQARMNRAYMKGRYNDVVDLLAEIEMLRKARVFVATFSSNLARLVHVLRNADERDSVSLDDRWAPGVAWLTFGQQYCHWPGANETFCKSWSQAF